MRLNSKWLAVLLFLAVLPLSGCDFTQKLRARDNLNKGVKAFREQKFDAAAQFFEKSVQLDPKLEDARMYLASAYTSQFVPGSTDPKSEEMANKAIQTFKEIVAMAGDTGRPNENAMISIASLYYQLKKYNESKEWCQKILKLDEKNADAYYRIAVMDFDDSLEKTGIQGENVDYMNPEEKTKALADIDEGLTCLGKALEIRPNYFDALEYQNLLWREKAKFEKNENTKAELLRQAGLAAQKALELRKKAQQEEASRPRKMAG